MSEIIETVVDNYFEGTIGSLEFMRDSLDIRLGRLTKMLRLPEIAEYEEEVVLGFAAQCSNELHLIRSMIKKENKSFETVKTEREKRKNEEISQNNLGDHNSSL